jgi:hypothetical protein
VKISKHYVDSKKMVFRIAKDGVYLISQWRSIVVFQNRLSFIAEKGNIVDKAIFKSSAASRGHCCKK